MIGGYEVTCSLLVLPLLLRLPLHSLSDEVTAVVCLHVRCMREGVRRREGGERAARIPARYARIPARYARIPARYARIQARYARVCTQTRAHCRTCTSTLSLSSVMAST
eukprot:3735314-Rhodomonas_salina.1